MTTDVVLLSLLASGVLALLVGAGFGAARIRNWSAPAALGAGLACAGTASWLILLATWLAPHAGAVASVAVVIGAITLLVLTRAWEWWRPAAAPLLVALGALFFAGGMLLLWASTRDPFTEAENRFYDFQLPGDDRLPARLASWITFPGSGDFLDGDWSPSDRPPLQAGFILLFRTISTPLAAAIHAQPASVDFAASVTAQLLWVPAVLALLIALGFRRRAALSAVAFAAVVPVVFVNTVFTWPKTLAAAFVVAALALLVAGLRRTESAPRALVLAALLSTWGVLSHGGAAFVLPLILIFAAVLLGRISRTQRWVVALVAVAVPCVAYGPWLLYQRFAYPPGDRLLKWHLAGVIPLDDRSFLRALADQYTSTPIPELLAARISNLDRALNPLLVFADAYLGNRASLAARAHREFFDTPTALGISFLLAVALLIVWIARRVRHRGTDETLSWSAIVVAGSFCCIVLWALAMFLPASAVVHQGSQAWMLVLIAVPFACIYRARPILALVLFVGQLSWTLLLYTIPTLTAQPIMRPAMLVVVLAGLTALALSIPLDRLLTRRRGCAGTRDPGEPEVQAVRDTEGFER